MSVAHFVPPKPFELRGDHLTVELPGARVVFTTRRGGHSRGPYSTLNLGLKTEDSRDAVIANRRALAEELGLRLTFVRQVHGRRVMTVPAEGDRAGRIVVRDGERAHQRVVTQDPRVEGSDSTCAGQPDVHAATP